MLTNFFMVAFSAMNFPLSTAFIVSHKFGYVVPSFSLTTTKSLMPFFISSMTQRSLSRELFNFYECIGFAVFLLSKSSFNPGGQIRYKMYLNFLVCVEAWFVTNCMVSFREGSMQC